jgi:acyltransferase
MGGPEPSRAQAHRVIFIDLARALAVVFMLYGHTIDTVLAPGYRVGTWYDVWLFQRGLTSSLFLLLSGFAFSIATSRHWTSHAHWSPVVVKRVRRFGGFVLLGYLLHVPVARFVLLPSATDAQWQAFLAVDVLQLIGVTYIGVQALVLVTRSRTLFTVATLVLAVAVVAITPLAWSADWSGVLPPAIAAYVYPAQGFLLPLFPLLPWSAYLLCGVSLGQIYARWGGANLVTFANVVLLLPGLALLGLGYLLRTPPLSTLWVGPGYTVPMEFANRAGVCLLLLAAIAYASRRVARLHHVFSAVAQETLLIYFVHLCIVYGSVWNQGLWQIYGQTLGPLPTLVCVVTLIASMTVLASYWNGFKHTRPRAAKWTSVAAIGLLLVRLL